MLLQADKNGKTPRKLAAALVRHYENSSNSFGPLLLGLTVLHDTDLVNQLLGRTENGIFRPIQGVASALVNAASVFGWDLLRPFVSFLLNAILIIL